jgi:hypothetical protein
VQPVDMFPHTHHIENIVQLKLKASRWVIFKPDRIRCLRL